MITFQTTGVVKASVEKVFMYLADPKRIPEWRRDVRRISEVKGPIQVGSTFFEEGGAKQLLMKVIEFVPNKKLVIEAQGGMSTLPTQSFIFTPDGRSTRVYVSITLRTSALLAPFGFIFSSRLKGKWNEYFMNLDRVLGDDSQASYKQPTLTRR